MLRKHQQALKAKMGAEAYKSMRESRVRTKGGSVPKRPSSPEGSSSGAGQVTPPTTRTAEPKTPVKDRVRSGRVLKACPCETPSRRTRPLAGRLSDLTARVSEDSSSEETWRVVGFRPKPDAKPKPKPIVCPEFKRVLKPSAECQVPAKGCLKKAKAWYQPENDRKEVRFGAVRIVYKISTLADINPKYHAQHGDGDCHCKKCNHAGAYEPVNESNTITLEVLDFRLRGKTSMQEDTLELDKALLLARFNSHRMAGEALQGSLNFFYTDLYLNKKSKRALEGWRELYSADESALELMRAKRRRGSFYKIGQREWEFLDLDNLAPEVRSSEPRTELDIHWNTVEDSQMKGFKLDKKSNKQRTLAERDVIESERPMRIRFPASFAPTIRVPEPGQTPSVDPYDEADLDELDLDEPEVVRPVVRNLWN